MTPSLPLRRVVIVVGLAVALVAAVGAVRLAAAWTASAAPLTVSPVSVAALRADLADEQARSAALSAELKALGERSHDLQAALEQAHGRITADTEHAHDLDARLAAATDRLAKVEAALDRARAAVRSNGASSGSRSAAVRVPSAAEDGEDHHEGGDHED
jgi:hypothetical protein